jgi:hypothetical protein
VILFPTSVAAIKRCGFLIKNEITFAGKNPSLLSNSTRNLLEVRNAISIPEKNAEDNIENNMILIGFKARLS